MMIKTELVFSKNKEKVFSYLLDFSNIFEWNKNIVEAKRIDLGSVLEGSQFFFAIFLMGRKIKFEVILKKIERDKNLVFLCKSENIKIRYDFSFKLCGDNIILSVCVETSFDKKIDYILLNSSIKKSLFLSMKNLESIFSHEEKGSFKDSNLNFLNLSSRFSAIGWRKSKKYFHPTFTKEKTVLITGCTSGIGRSAVYNFAGKGCDLVLVARNKDKLLKLVKDLKEKGFNKAVLTYICNMEDINEVKKTCLLIKKDKHKLDVIVNNAGALFDKAESIDGIERTTVVDFISPWIISNENISSLNVNSCIINVSSGGMYSTKLDLKRLKDASSSFSGAKAYALAKRAINIMTQGMNEDLFEKKIRVHSMHPGWVDTPGVLGSLPIFYKITRYVLRTPFQGADTIIWLAMQNPKEGGRFWLDRVIQKEHILSSTKENYKKSYDRLKKFIQDYLF